MYRVMLAFPIIVLSPTIAVKTSINKKAIHLSRLKRISVQLFIVIDMLKGRGSYMGSSIY